MPDSTLDAALVPLMRAPSVRLGHCAICGRPAPLNQHHMVRRGAGALYRGGVEVPKPTITLCGYGNNLRDADGRYYCHGLAHHLMLHFRWVDDDPARPDMPGEHAAGAGHLEYIKTAEPTDYQTALGMEGWRRVRCRP